MPGLCPALDAVRSVAFDLDGVLYEADAPIPGASATVRAVRDTGRAVRFVTNTTSRSRRLIVEKLHRLGFDVSADEVFCPTRGAATWLQQRGARAAFFLPEPALEDFERIPHDDERPDAVVIGDLGSGWTFERLNRAFRLVHERGAQLVGLGRTRYWKGPAGLQLDVGAFLAAIEHATDRKAVVFGKPEPAFFEALVDELGVTASDVAMVGDDIVTDVGAAMAAGLVGILVRTGKFKPQDLEGDIRPDLVIGSVRDLIGWHSGL